MNGGLQGRLASIGQGILLFFLCFACGESRDLAGPQLDGNTTKVLPDGLGPQFAYWERSYSGWFGTSQILSTHVEASLLQGVINHKTPTYFPTTFDAYTTTFPNPFTYFDILWSVNSYKVQWQLLYEQDGNSYEYYYDSFIKGGYRLQQVKSYSNDGIGVIRYAALFVKGDSYWSSRRSQAVHGYPYTQQYCCGSTSRWASLKAKGYRPVSITMAQDPATGTLYVADLWDNLNSRYKWVGGISLTAEQLHDAFNNLDPSFTMSYVSSYRFVHPNGWHQVFFNYIAYQQSRPFGLKLTTDVSRSGFLALTQMVPKPPLTFTAYSFDGEAEPDRPGSGEMYTTIWQGIGQVGENEEAEELVPLRDA